MRILVFLAFISSLAKAEDYFLSAWRLWWMQQLRALDHSHKHMERVLIEMALRVLDKQQQRKLQFQSERERLVSISSGGNLQRCTRMARTCPPKTHYQRQDLVAVEIRPTGEISEYEHHQSSSSALGVEAEDISNYDLVIGTVLNVYNSQDRCNSDSEDSSAADYSGLPLCADVNRGNHVVDVSYELIEPMHTELGIDPKHTFDYAYRPVLNRISDEATSSRIATRENFVPLPEVPSKQGVKVETSHSAEFQVIPQQPNFSKRKWWQWISPPFKGFSWGGPQDETHKQKAYETMGSTAFAGGSHGEVWRARKRCVSCQQKDLIMKRLKVAEYGFPLLEAGLREVYFGSLLEQEAQEVTTRYVDHFFRQVERHPTFVKSEMELWIVFENAGPSLRSYLYTPVDTGDFVVYQNSDFWTRLRMSVYKNKRSEKKNQDDGSVVVRRGDAQLHESSAHPDASSQSTQDEEGASGVPHGRHVMREVLRQILTAAAFLHEQGIVHRDIKPSNVMCTSNFAPHQRTSASKNDQMHLECVLGDFSSAWDVFTAENLYVNGPSAAEQTDAYAPPEALFGPTWVPFNEEKPQSYDSWSIGVLALELLLGTPNVFSVDQRTTALLTNKLTNAGASDQEIQRALYLAALSQFCIYLPTTDSTTSWPLRAGDPLHNAAMTKQSCTIQDFHHALRARDPLGLGFDSSSDLLLHLIWGLLAWDPLERLTAAQALNHDYFTSSTEQSDDSSSDLIPGDHNAIESQSLDPRMDFQIFEPISEFVCPKCNRTFDNWQSCHIHTNSRRHGKFCLYNTTSLPTCINVHSMLPAHPTSGYCDIQGRRRVMEDFHAVQLHATHQYFGMFDGHTGNLASKYVASTFYERVRDKLLDLNERVVVNPEWKFLVEKEMGEAFRDTHHQFLEAVTFSPLDIMDQSGTTATILYVTDQAVVVASLGDSRAVLAANQKTNSMDELVAVQLTIDHVAGDPSERKLIEQRGGFVSSSGGIDRVNGTLAVTRSIGDANLAPLLSRVPHVVAMDRTELRAMCGPKRRDGLPCFVLLASDGLWDVMSNQEAVDMVALVVQKFDSKISWEEGGAFQEAAQKLTHEAYVRGSTDNIGVCVVAIE